MATKSFEVKNYLVSVWAIGRKPLSFIKCEGAEPDHLFLIYFVEDMESAPQNRSKIEPNLVVGSAYAPAEQYVWYVDLLRNEPPVYAVVNDSLPLNNHLSTVRLSAAAVSDHYILGDPEPRFADHYPG